MGEIEKYIGRRLDGGNVIPVAVLGARDGPGADFLRYGFDLSVDREHKFGANPDIDTASVPEDIWETGGIYPGFLSSAANCEIVSNDAADSPGGAGAHSVEIIGLDQNFAFKTNTVTLNGDVGPVAIGSYLRIFRAIVRTAGPPTFTNIGTISITTVPGEGSTPMATILPAIGQTLMSIYTVPAEYQAAWLLQLSASLRAANAQARTATIALQTRPFGGAWNTKDYLELHSYGGLAVQPSPLTRRIETRTDIRMTVLSVSMNATFVNSTFDLLLEPMP